MSIAADPAELTPLQDLLGRGTMPLGEVLDIGAGIARLLAQAHRTGRIRDGLHPACVLVRRGPTADVEFIDHAAVTLTDKPAYMAPEQTGRTGRSVDQRADLYSLGAILYELAAGRRAFESGDALRMMHERLALDPPSPSVANPGVPGAVSALILKLLAKEPDLRYQSAEGVVHDLVRARAQLAAGKDAAFELGQHDFPALLVAPAIVGREAESAALQSAYRAAMRGPCRTALVDGAPGIGKSALVEQLKPVVAADGGAFLYGKFDPTMVTAATGGPVTQVLRSLGQWLLALPKDELALRRARMLDAVGANGGLVTRVPEFALLLGEQPELAPADPKHAELRLIETFVDLLRAVASPELPLAIFFDDLQWAPGLELRFFEKLIAANDMQGLFLAGTYRSTEVDAAHPLSPFLSHWGASPQPPVRIALEPLEAPAVAEMVGRMLRLPAARAAELGSAVSAVANGNPFDTVETVNGLRAAGILALRRQGWDWDPAAIRGFAGKRDAMDMLVAHIGSLPEDSLALLQVMSCMGAALKYPLLEAATGCDAAALAARLQVPLAEKFVIPAGASGESVRFRHDRVKHAVAATLSAAARSELLLGLARRLHAHPELRFHAAARYLECSEQLEDAAERARVSALFADAGRQAVAGANFALAERYLSAAGKLLEGGDEPAGMLLRIAIDRDRHLALYSLGRFDELDAVYLRLATALRNEPLELAAIARLHIRGLDARGRMNDSLDLGLQLLAQFGVELPTEYSDEAVYSRLDGVADWVAREQAMGPSALKVLSEPRLVAIAQVLSCTARSAYFLNDPRPFIWLLLESQRFWAKNGPSPAIAGLLGRLATVVVSYREDYRTACAVARHVLEVSEALGYEPETSEARNVYASYGCHWSEPLEESARHATLSREGAQSSGDLSYASYLCVTPSYVLLDFGASLHLAEAEAALGIEFARRAGNVHAETMHRLMAQLIRCLRGLTDAPTSFGDAAFAEEEVLSRTGHLPWILSLHADNHALAAALLGDLPSLVRHTAVSVADSPRGPGDLSRAPGFYTTWHAFLWLGLQCAWQLREEPDVDRAARMATLERCREWLAQRAHDAPANFLHLAHLLAAEQAWALGELWQAAVEFDAARACLENLQRPWQRALVKERAGLFQLAHGMVHGGRATLAAARDLYAAWGAQGKVRAMEAQHPWLAGMGHAPAAAAPSAARATDAQSAEQLDLVGVLRASQALSSETSLPRLTSRVVEVLAALTGATRVALLSFADDGWWVHGSADDGTAFEPLPLAEAAGRGLVPLSAVRYVDRTGEVLSVDDAAAEPRLARDRYFSTAGHCSLLVVPIKTQAGTRAMLLLENRMGRSAFAAEGLDAVMMIAGQLAVSLSNVRLYESLEQRVRTRTEELEATQAELVATARRAGMAQIANNVLHNVGNVLNSVTVAASLLDQRLRDSHARSLKRVVALLEEHKHDLGEFITRDARGSKLPAYLGELSLVVETEHGEMLSELARLTRSVNHIRSVLRGQQSLAGGVSSIPEIVALDEAFEDTLRMTADTVSSYAVTVVKQLGELPALSLDKPRLLQILVNLVTNACEAMDGTGGRPAVLTLAAGMAQTELGERLRVTVRDTGHGIAAEHLQRIFSHGFTTKQGGHGFGLHSCAIAAMEMGGSLVATSDGPGAGTLFTLELPFEPADAAA